MKRYVCALLAVSSVALAPRAARAQEGRPFIEHGDVLMRGFAFEVGGEMGLGNTELGAFLPDGTLQPGAHALVIRDRHGMTARMVAGILVALSTAMAANSPKRVETREYTSGGYRYRETTTYYRSAEEQREIIESGNATIAGLFKISAAEFELKLYSRDRFGYGDASGYKLNFLYGGKIAESLNLTIGFGWGEVDSEVIRDGLTNRVHYQYLGMPFRLSGATRLFMWQLTWEWNWLGHRDNDGKFDLQDDDMNGIWNVTVSPHPIHLDFYGAVYGQLMGGAGVTMASTDNPTKLGYRLYAGLRF